MIRYSLSGYDCGVSPSNDGSLVSYSEARAEIERLEKEVAEYDRTIGLFLGALPIKDIIPAAGSIKDLILAISRLSDDRKRAERERDTAWNDAIEAAAAVRGLWLGIDAGTGELDGTYCSVDPENGSKLYISAAAILSLKRG